MAMMLHSIDTKCILSALIINILRVFPFSVNIKSPTAVDSTLYKSEVWISEDTSVTPVPFTFFFII